MNKPFSLLALGLALFFQACEGPMGLPGPQGPQGPQGQAGINILGEVIEIENVNFTAGNGYREIFEFLNDPIEESDKIMAFLLWDIDNGTDIWRPLPQTVFLPSGTLIYNFDFSRFDFSFFLDANFPLSEVPNEFSRNQIFRILILPADFSNARLDYSNYEELMKYLGKEEKDVIKYKDLLSK